MKKELLDKLLNEFDKDKEIIKRNLLEVMDVIILEAKDKYGSFKLIINYERNDENDAKDN